MTSSLQKRKTTYSFLLQNIKKPHCSKVSGLKKKDIEIKVPEKTQSQTSHSAQKNKIHFSKIQKRKSQINRQEIKNIMERKKSLKSSEKKQIINPKFKERQFITKKRKRVVVIRKKNEKGQTQYTNDPQAFISCSRKVNTLIKSKNKSFGLQYFPTKTYEKVGQFLTGNNIRMMKFRQPDLNSAFYNSFYRGQNQNDRERERERRNTNGHFYENSVKNYKLLEPETRGISFCSEYKEYNAKIRKRFSNNLKKTYLNNFPPRSKTQEFGNIKDMLCGWEDNESYSEQKNIEEFNSINNLNY